MLRHDHSHDHGGLNTRAALLHVLGDLAASVAAIVAMSFAWLGGIIWVDAAMALVVALRMLDAPVTHDHGGPVRLYVAPMYGYKSLKWLSGIELTREVVPGYWEDRGYSVDGWVGGSNGRSDRRTS